MNQHNARAELIDSLRRMATIACPSEGEILSKAAAMLEAQPAEQVAALKKRDLTGLGPDNGASTYFRGLGWNEAIDAMALQPAEQAVAALGENLPKCRDCADFGPICPNSGKPCGGDQPAEQANVLEALIERVVNIAWRFRAADSMEKLQATESELRAALLSSDAQPAREWVGLTNQRTRELITGYFDAHWAINKATGLLEQFESELRQKNAGLPAADDKAAVMTPDQINEVNEALWAELDEIKEKTGYNTYREANRGMAHWTLLGYLLNLKHRADDKAGGECDNPDFQRDAIAALRESTKAIREWAAIHTGQPAADDKAGWEPLFYVRFLSDGLYEGPIHRNVRHYFDGEWTPLYTNPQPQAEVRAPDGYVLVPVEPTDDMLHCAQDRVYSLFLVDARNIWDAMLSAAPKPQDDLPAILKKQAS